MHRIFIVVTLFFCFLFLLYVNDVRNTPRLYDISSDRLSSIHKVQYYIYSHVILDFNDLNGMWNVVGKTRLPQVVTLSNVIRHKENEGEVGGE